MQKLFDRESQRRFEAAIRMPSYPLFHDNPRI